jgi:hypothetical protein
MRLGTLEVWARLPDGSAHITEKQIHEALWHYYYDMDKTVGYLITTYIAKPKKEQKKAAVGKKATGGSLISLAFTEMGTVDLENHQRLDWAGGGFLLLFADHNIMGFPADQSEKTIYILRDALNFSLLPTSSKILHGSTSLPNGKHYSSHRYTQGEDYWEDRQMGLLKCQNYRHWLQLERRRHKNRNYPTPLRSKSQWPACLSMKKRMVSVRK